MKSNRFPIKTWLSHYKWGNSRTVLNHYQTYSPLWKCNYHDIILQNVGNIERVQKQAACYYSSSFIHINQRLISIHKQIQPEADKEWRSRSIVGHYSDHVIWHHVTIVCGLIFSFCKQSTNQLQKRFNISKMKLRWNNVDTSSESL